MDLVPISSFAIKESTMKSMIILAALFSLMCSTPQAQTDSARADEKFVYSLAFQSEIFGYPLLGMYQRLSDEVLNPETRKASFNQYFHYRALATPTVSPFPAPNNDTLYSTAWLDLRHGPVILSMPDTKGRYYTAHIMDLTTETIANFGQRLNGTKAARFAVVGPGWKGALPRGIKDFVRSETVFASVLLRILVDGPSDVSAVNALQDQFGIEATRQADTKMSLSLFTTGDGQKRLDQLRDVISLSPIAEKDRGMVLSFAPLGITKLPDTFSVVRPDALISAAQRDARQLIASVGPKTGKIFDGWRYPPVAIGRYGADYLQRSSVWDGGPLANVTEEAFYPAALLDSSNRMLDGQIGTYKITFFPDKLPPAKAFWSLTMYRLDDKNLVENPIQRYSIGNRTKGLRYNSDGSLSIFIQADEPDPINKTNWLPAPRQPFYMVLRLYGPNEWALSGQWKAPPVERVKVLP